MSKESNFLISASAGTGKTFALATHVIRLLLAGEEPYAIAALTFSRLAAAEIFDRVVQRLATAAASPEKAAKEESDIVKGCPDGVLASIRVRHPGGLDASAFLDTLRTFLDEQHRSLLGTIDSFLGRMVQLFPTEMGLQGPVELLEDDDRALLREATVAGLFASEEETDFLQLKVILRAASGEKSAKTYHGRVASTMKDWQETLLDQPAPSAWGDAATLFGGDADAGFLTALRLPSEQALDEIRAAADRFQSAVTPLCLGNDRKLEYLETFCRTACETPETCFSSNTETAVKNFLDAVQTHTVKCGRTPIDLGAAEMALLLDIVRRLQAYVLGGTLRRARGLYALLLKLETRYSQNVRAQGRLEFSDIPRLIANLGLRDSAHLRDLEFRFDTQFRHLSLDEFQDTSHPQWNALRPTIDELKQSSDGHSLFVVGDVKQAIYGWRGGDSRLFAEEKRKTDVYTVSDLTESYRFRPEISAFVNTVFGNALSKAFQDQAKAKAACSQWESFWVTHQSHNKTPGYVRVERGAETPDGTEMVAGDSEDHRFSNVRLIVQRLQTVEPWRRGLTAAVLVRSNGDGLFVADTLRANGIPAVWEGESAISDTPVVKALLDLLVLAEHPDGKRLEWGHIQATPIESVLFPDADVSSPAKLSRRVAEDVSRKGLATALRDWCALIESSLPEGEASPELRIRFEALVAAATDFVRNTNRTGTLFDFNRFVAHRTKRDFADASTVKIVTQHRSKGLGFDLVFVPVFAKKSGFAFYEPALGTHMTPSMLHGPGDVPAWILPYVGESLRNGIAPLEKAFRDDNDAKTFEDLCLLYVSATRAKAELFFALPPSKKKSGPSDLSIPAYLEDVLGGLPYAKGNADWFQGKPVSDTKTGRAAAGRRKPVVPPSSAAPRRLTPSKEHVFGRSAADLFSNVPRAEERGTSLHERLSRIEWLEPGAPQPADIPQEELDLVADSPFRRALERPADAVGLWRERSFELLADNKWMSGTFDRVVFRDTPDGRRIELYDYKSNRMRRDETKEDFETRMKETYAGQMESYREALHRLSGVPKSAISATLLLVATQSCVDCV